MSRGCPRGCSFCHVATKEGKRSYKVADLEEFWNDQPFIDILDPNTLACPDWSDILTQLAKSRAKVNFNQGLDIRLMTEEKAEALSEIKLEMVHFAWDRYEDGNVILPKLEAYKRKVKCNKHSPIVYVLCNYDSTIQQDLNRVYELRKLDYQPYIMLYDKEHIPKKHPLRHLQRWVNNPWIFWSVDKFEDYERVRL